MTGQYCLKIKDITKRISDQCTDCGEIQRLVDNEFGNIYSFSCIVASKMTTSIGIRRRGEPQMTEGKYKLDTSEMRARHNYMVNEVPEELFQADNQKRK